MEKIEVTINEDLVTAKEVNPYKGQLDKEERLGYNLSFGLAESWRSYENGLRTFEIDSVRGLTTWNAIKVIKHFGSGSRYEAIILPNGRIQIL